MDRRQNPKRILRWIAVIPATIAAWYASLLTGLLLFAVAESFCPESEIVSGMCVAGWFRAAERTIFVFCAALAAWLLVTSPALVAPQFRPLVAAVAYGLGLCLALYLGISTGSWAELASAALAGALAVAWIVRRERRRAAGAEGAAGA